MQRKDLEALLADVKELLRFERLILEGKISQEDVKILKSMAERGIPRAEYDYGLYFLVCLHDCKTAHHWFEKCQKHANEKLLGKLSVAHSLMREEPPQRRGE